MLKYYIIKIEAHLTKSISRKRPPWLWKKGVGAEADAVAGILAGDTENIRGAVAFICEELSFYSAFLRVLEGSWFVAIFFCFLTV